MRKLTLTFAEHNESCDLAGQKVIEGCQFYRYQGWCKLYFDNVI